MNAEVTRKGVALWVKLLYPDMEMDQAQATADKLQQMFPAADWEGAADKAYREVVRECVTRGYWQLVEEKQP